MQCQSGTLISRGSLTCLNHAVKKFALKVYTRNWAIDYGSLLKFCNLPTLASRRQYLKLCFLYQVIDGTFIFPNVPIARHSITLNLRGTSSPFLLYRLLTCTNAYQYSFFPTCISLWDKLPSFSHKLRLLCNHSSIIIIISCLVAI